MASATPKRVFDAAPAAVGPKPARWQNRIVGLQHLPVRELQVHPLNWRTHPAGQQAALTGVLEDVGMASPLLVYASEKYGGLTIIDGHLRASLDGDQPWPCLLLDVTDEEALLLLATHDPLAELAEANTSLLEEVLSQLGPQAEAVQALLESLSSMPGERVPTIPMPEYDEQVVDKVSYHECPECHHRWPR